jgi:hypothetical protein
MRAPGFAMGFANSTGFAKPGFLVRSGFTIRPHWQFKHTTKHYWAYVKKK